MKSSFPLRIDETPLPHLMTGPEKHLFQLMTGFFASKLLAVAVELDLFSWLSQKPRQFEEIRVHCGLALRPCQILLDALVSINLLAYQDRRYENTATAELLLVRGQADFQGPHIQLLDHLYVACADLKSALLENRPVNQDYSYFFQPAGGEVTGYSHLMHNSSLIPAMVLPQYWDFSDSQTVLDIGGGYGRLCLSLVTQYPTLHTILFDLPAVCEKANMLLAQQPASITARIEIHPGDFFRDPLPDTADIMVMMRVAHDWPRTQVAEIFHKAYVALPHGGHLLIYETFKDNESRPGEAALISLLLLLISPGGECRTFADVATLLREVGFSRIERIPTVYCYSLVVAEKD